MFEKRTDLIRFLAVNEAGRIAATAERLAITQPTLTRDIARLERCVGGRLFERLPGSVRLTARGVTVAATVSAQSTSGSADPRGAVVNRPFGPSSLQAARPPG